SVRPTAPPLGAENVPRHLVYSEPPQSQRWSQRVQFSPVDNTEMGLNLLRDTGVTESRLTAEPVSAAESLDAVADASTRRTSSTGAGTSSTTTVSARHGEELGRGNEVDEAEFEDLASESPEGAK